MIESQFDEYEYVHEHGSKFEVIVATYIDFKYPRGIQKGYKPLN